MTAEVTSRLWFQKIATGILAGALIVSFWVTLGFIAKCIWLLFLLGWRIL